MADGLEIAQDNTQLVLREITAAIDKGLEEIGLVAEGHVVGKIEHDHIVDTGTLRDSITHAVIQNKTAVVIGTNVEYAAYVELGTRRMAARPYLKDTVASHMSEYEGILKAELGNA